MRIRRFAPVFLAALCFGGAPPSTPSLSERLVGTWKVVTHQERKSPEEKWKDAYGSDPRGYLMYDQTGHMSVQITRVPRPRFTGREGDPTPDEALDVVYGYLAYFGTFSVNEKTGVITDHVESGLWPDYIGTDQERPATLEGDRLTLSDGKTWRVVWARVLR